MEQRHEQREERKPGDMPAARRSHQRHDAHGEGQFPTQRCDQEVGSTRRDERISGALSDSKQEGSYQPDEADRREDAQCTQHEVCVLSVCCLLVPGYRIGGAGATDHTCLASPLRLPLFPPSQARDDTYGTERTSRKPPAVASISLMVSHIFMLLVLACIARKRYHVTASS